MKFRRMTLVVATAAVVTGLVPSAVASPLPAASAGGTIPLLTVGLSTPFESLDQTKTYDAPDITDLSLETLMKLGPQGRLEPNLASSVSQPNPVTYIYHLRPGIKFWDGDAMTAADVAYSWNYNRAVGSDGAYSYTSVKSVRATGPYTVVVTLTHPDASWQYTPALNTSEVFEMKFAQSHKGTYGNPGVLVMGSGPWEIDSFDPTTGADLSANPHWWGGAVPIEHISFKFFASDTSLALAMRAGEIDFDFSVLGGQRSFASTSGAKLVSTPSCDIGMFSMNTQVAPWDDVHVRRAVAYALNRADLIAANGGYATPVYTLISPESLGTIASPVQIDSLLKSVPLYKYNVSMAKAEMAQSAYPHGFTGTLAEYSGDTATNISQVIAAELQKIGITLHVRLEESPAWSAAETGPAGKRPSTFFSAGCVNPDPGALPDTFLGSANLQAGGYDFADYNPPAVNQLVITGGAATSPAQRFAIYSKLLQRLATDVPYVPLFNVDFSVALASKFTYAGFTPWYPDSEWALDIKETA